MTLRTAPPAWTGPTRMPERAGVCGIANANIDEPIRITTHKRSALAPTVGAGALRLLHHLSSGA